MYPIHIQNMDKYADFFPRKIDFNAAHCVVMARYDRRDPQKTTHLQYGKSHPQKSPLHQLKIAYLLINR